VLKVNTDVVHESNTLMTTVVLKTTC